MKMGKLMNEKITWNSTTPKAWNCTKKMTEEAQYFSCCQIQF